MRRQQRGRRGAALLLVLWIFMLLGVLAFDFGQYMRDDAMAAINLAEETRGYYLAVGGMNRAIYDQFLAEEIERVEGEGPDALPPEDQPPLIQVDGQWQKLELLGGQVEVRITDEAGRIPLGVPLDPSEDGAVNADALGTLLTAVITNLVRGGNQTEGVDGHEQKRIQTVVNSILDWLDVDDEVRIDGAEADYYEGLEPSRAAKNGVLDSPEELLLIKGMDADFFYGVDGRPGLRDVVSVFNPNVAVDLRRASTEVLQALFGIDAEEATELRTLRLEAGAGDTLYGDRLAELVQIAGQGRLQVDEEGILTPVDETGEFEGGDVDALSAVFVEARADVSEPRNQSRVAAVVLLNDLDCELSYCRSVTNEGVTVLRWFDRGPWSREDEAPAPASEGVAE